MKRKLFVCISAAFIFFTGILSAKETVTYQVYELDKLIREIEGPGAPVITDDYIIFTAEPKYRYVGIAFDFEDYKIVHPFKILTETDMDGNKKSKHYFYAYTRTHKISQIKYRLIIDGLWTTDPMNPVKEYDEDINLYFSKVEDRNSIRMNTEITPRGTVHFVYKGKSGLKLNLAGTFTSWDPWIYQMKETSAGMYELELPLPPGKYYYNYYIGLTPVMDNTNPKKAYHKDGRTVSVIEVN